MEKAYKILKTILLILCFVALLLGASRLYEALSSRVQPDTLATQSTGSSTEPQTAPDFALYDAQGGKFHLSDFRGKPVILNFWASWCGPCKMEMPDFQEKFQEYGETIQFLMVNLTDGAQETVQTAAAFVEKQGYTFPVYFDTAMEGAMAYGVTGVPVTYFLDAEGHFVAWQQGMLTADTLQKGIDLLLG